MAPKLSFDDRWGIKDDASSRARAYNHLLNYL
jgi:hypothetical protein